MQEIINFIEGVGTPIIVGLLLAYFQHLNNKRYEKMDKRAELRKKESLVGLNLAEANAKLSYAVAMALKRGTANGEVEDGIRAYKKALKSRDDFLKETSAEYLRK